MSTLENDHIFTEGTRVWVWDPLLLGDRAQAGKVIGFTVSLAKFPELTNSSVDVEYLVDFGDFQEWIGDFQITGFVAPVRDVA